VEFALPAVVLGLWKLSSRIWRHATRMIVAEFVPSEIVAVPRFPPPDTVIDATVLLLTDCAVIDAPETPEIVNVVVPLTHDVPEPVSAMTVLTLVSTTTGDVVKDAMEPPGIEKAAASGGGAAKRR